MIGCFFFPHSADINIRFYEDGSFVFHDFDPDSGSIVTRRGWFHLTDSSLVMTYLTNTPEDRFRFYRGRLGTADSLNYYLSKPQYYFVKTECDEQN